MLKGTKDVTTASTCFVKPPFVKFPIMPPIIHKTAVLSSESLGLRFSSAESWNSGF